MCPSEENRVEACLSGCVADLVALLCFATASDSAVPTVVPSACLQSLLVPPGVAKAPRDKVPATSRHTSLASGTPKQAKSVYDYATKHGPGIGVGSVCWFLVQDEQFHHQRFPRLTLMYHFFLPVLCYGGGL